jgi:hypothetical protein
LRWEHGSIDAILDGGGPAPMDPEQRTRTSTETRQARELAGIGEIRRRLEELAEDVRRLEEDHDETG